MDKKPVYTAQEILSNIVYGMTSVNNINQDELDSIQYICEQFISSKDTIIMASRQNGKTRMMKVKLNQLLNSRAIEQLEKVKEEILKISKAEIKTLKNGYSTLYIDRSEVIVKIDHLINELKQVEDER